MGSTRVYLTPFNEDGTYADDEIDVSEYVPKLGAIKVDADSLDYHLGVFRTSSAALQLSNRHGKFSQIDQLESIFRYKRSDSLVRITWMLGKQTPVAGFVNVEDMILGEEVTVFEGLLNDDGFKEDAKTELVDFKVLGFESLFERATVPFEDVAIGDTASELIYLLLNQEAITDLLTVDEANINCDIDLEVDAVDFLENQTVKEALDKLLLISNSVLYIRDRTVFVTNRDPSASVEMEFFGQASPNGIENLISVDDIVSGMNRCWNYFYWRDTSNVQKDNTSIRKFRTRKQEIDFEAYTDNTKQGTILQALLADFKDPKRELKITVPLDYDSLALELFDKITIDYPTVFVPTEGHELPICGVAVCGSESSGVEGAVLPMGLWSLTIEAEDEWKILGKEVDTENHKVTLKVREV